MTDTSPLSYTQFRPCKALPPSIGAGTTVRLPRNTATSAPTSTNMQQLSTVTIWFNRLWYASTFIALATLGYIVANQSLWRFTTPLFKPNNADVVGASSLPAASVTHPLSAAAPVVAPLISAEHLAAQATGRIIEQFYQQSMPAEISPLWLSQRYLQSYNQWLHQSHQRHNQVAQYQAFLHSKKVDTVLPMPLIISSQRDTVACNVDPWVLPPKALWPNLVNTLRILRTLQKNALITPQDLISSVYRGVSQNGCAKGASKSKHLENYAIDIELHGKDAAKRYQQVCAFWHTQGKSLNLGLGTYTNHKIHIDGAGYRTWGVDYTHATSQCW